MKILVSKYYKASSLPGVAEGRSVFNVSGTWRAPGEYWQAALAHSPEADFELWEIKGPPESPELKVLWAHAAEELSTDCFLSGEALSPYDRRELETSVSQALVLARRICLLREAEGTVPCVEVVSDRFSIRVTLKGQGSVVKKSYPWRPLEEVFEISVPTEEVGWHPLTGWQVLRGQPGAVERAREVAGDREVSLHPYTYVKGVEDWVAEPVKGTARVKELDASLYRHVKTGEICSEAPDEVESSLLDLANHCQVTGVRRITFECDICGFYGSYWVVVDGNQVISHHTSGAADVETPRDHVDELEVYKRLDSLLDFESIVDVGQKFARMCVTLGIINVSVGTYEWD